MYIFIWLCARASLSLSYITVQSKFLAFGPHQVQVSHDNVREIPPYLKEYHKNPGKLNFQPILMSAHLHVEIPKT